MKNIAEKSLGVLIDELITTLIKHYYRSKTSQESQDEIGDLEKRKLALMTTIDTRMGSLKENNGEDLKACLPSSATLGTLLGELAETLIRCWDAQEKIMETTDLFQAGLAAKEAQTYNAKRNELIRKIDSRLGDKEISVTSKTYS